jgi:hypothetical protein
MLGKFIPIPRAGANSLRFSGNNFKCDCYVNGYRELYHLSTPAPVVENLTTVAALQKHPCLVRMFNFDEVGAY